MTPAPAPRIRPHKPREKGTVATMTELGSPATMCQAFQQTAERYPKEVALRTVGGAAHHPGGAGRRR